MSKNRSSPQAGGKNKPEARKNAWWKDTLSVVLMAVVLALCVKTFLVDTRVVSSGSMLPTIELKDRVILSKLSYVGPRTPQGGDIVVFNAGQHIGIVSDRRNKKGQPYIIHNAGQPVRDENYLKRGIVYRHYRWDASRLSAEVAVPFVSQ